MYFLQRCCFQSPGGPCSVRKASLASRPVHTDPHPGSSAPFLPAVSGSGATARRLPALAPSSRLPQSRETVRSQCLSAAAFLGIPLQTPGPWRLRGGGGRAEQGDPSWAAAACGVGCPIAHVGGAKGIKQQVTTRPPGWSCRWGTQGGTLSWEAGGGQESLRADSSRGCGVPVPGTGDRVSLFGTWVKSPWESVCGCFCGRLAAAALCHWPTCSGLFPPSGPWPLPQGTCALMAILEEEPASYAAQLAPESVSVESTKRGLGKPPPHCQGGHCGPD